MQSKGAYRLNVPKKGIIHMSTTKTNQTKEKSNKVAAVIGLVLCVIFGFLLICNLTIIVKGTIAPERPPSVLGTTPMVVLSGSMSGEAEDHIEVGDLIFVGKAEAAASALRAARRLDVHDTALDAALDQAAGTDHDPDSVTDQQAADALAAEGLPDGANAEVAICLLMCATDAAGAGDPATATTLTLRARDLVGEPAMRTLLDIIRATDAELASEGGSDAE